MFELSRKFLPVFILSLFFCTPTFASTISRPMSNVGLVGYWNFEEGKGNSKTYDRSGFGNTGTLTNMNTDTAWVNGATTTSTGQALSFDGANDSIVLNNPVSFADDASWAVSFWVNPGTLDVTDYFFSGSIPYMAIDSSGNLIVKLGGGPPETFAVNIKANNFSHVVVVCDGTNNSDNIRVYVNGLFVSSASMFTSSQYISIIGNSGANYFSGVLDEVRIYNRALSSDEVSRLYKIQKPKVVSGINNTGLVGYWPLDEGTGIRAEDASFGNNNGTLNGGVTWTTGKSGGAVLLNGSNSVNMPTSYNFGTGDFTLSTWVKTTTTSNQVFLGNYYGGADYYYLSVGTDGAGIVRFNIDGGAVNSGSTLINDGNWHHVVGKRLAGVAYIFIDGVQRAIAGSMTGDAGSSSSSLSIGSIGTALFYFSGSVDEVREYNRALSDTEIYNLYKQGNKKTTVNKSKSDRMTNGLVGYWTFDGNKIYGTTAYDSGSGGNNGTLTNAPVVTIGKIGQALSFNGTNQYVNSSANPLSTTPNAPWSVSLWHKTSNYTNINPMPMFIQGIYLITTSGGNLGEQSGNGNKFVTETYAIDKWVFSTITYDGSKVIMYNGIDRNSLVATILETGATPALNSGGFKIGNDNFNEFYGGIIDEVRVYNRALSADEVKALYNMGK